MAEDLTDYLLESGVRTRYLHSEVDTLDRIKIIRELRLGEYDVLVGVNLLREGLDLPEVSLVAILDADKEGFLRGQTALIQTIGRAARNVNGKVVMYADKMTEAIKGAIDETNRRRDIQLRYNEEHGITPESIVKGVSDIAEFLSLESAPHVPGTRRRGQRQVEGMSNEELEKLVVTLEEEMFAAAEELRFEYAAKLRDEIKELRRELQATTAEPGLAGYSTALARRFLLLRLCLVVDECRGRELSRPRHVQARYVTILQRQIVSPECQERRLMLIVPWKHVPSGDCVQLITLYSARARAPVSHPSTTQPSARPCPTGCPERPRRGW